MRKFFIGFILTPFVFVAQLNKFVAEWANDKDLNNGIQSFCIYDYKNDLVLVEHNPHTFMIPASTMKAITTAAALKTLGNNYRFATKIAYTGKFDKTSGIVDGDIIIIGCGDPTIQSENFYKPDSAGLMDKWAQALAAAGVKEIKGKIIGDASAWEHQVPGHWIWADIGNYFGAVPCALSFMDNKFKVIFNSKEAGSQVEFVKVIPEILGNKMTIVNKVIAKGTEDEAFVYGDPFGCTKFISGKIPPNKKNFEVEAALPDPALLCAETLLNSLKKNGIKCAGTFTSNYEKRDTSIKSVTLYTHYSPSLEKIVQVTNITSNNLFAETILRAMAYGSPSNGIELVKKFLSAKGIETNELFMTDGSGLARADLVTTNLQAKMLGKIQGDPAIAKTFFNSLPVAGKQGSMSNIGKGTYIEGKMRAKTGYINKARAYCGYVTTKTGKELSFSIIFNNYSCSPKDAKLKIEKFLVALGEE
jgi:D-alanyl-D-alanine carboxypeptidase/D-alanyl-D-alanine-endopeptidase (penicillin-binding protein 4)